MNDNFGEIERKINQIKKIYNMRPNRNAALSILEQSKRSEINKILDYFSTHVPQIYVDINDNIILFEDLVQLDQSGIKKICSKFPPPVIGLALRLGDDKLRQNFLQNVSSDDRKSIEVIMHGPPKKKKDVEAAIGQIMTHVRSLVKQGTVKIVGGDNEKHVFI